ncbi:MAG: hypothetical protein CMQ15_03675 [Gammaproteobacteria bacterium]|jgi:putative hydrolase of the HAD superfamily|nr:hypothetical protein [Gammaproteobacteria bacterium]HJN96670.1 GMP/IMP nucleotidase [Gammaproteobacteria bacterium]|tara:strand:+ start:2639 stop:3307 length:669 start_codon:yes stop_codon:yes gene_type:complete
MPPWSTIDTIMFDMDGTLLDLHFDNYFWLNLVPTMYSRAHGVSEENAREIIRGKYAEVHGTLNWYCIDYWEDELQLDIAELKTTIKHKICVRPNVEKLLQELQRNNKRLLLITNAHPSSLKIKMDHTGIGDYFHKRISSHSLKLAKENHGFWESLQEIQSYEPERSLLFDDSVPVLRQAKREGIRHLYGIKQPDSQRPPLTPNEFPLIEDFNNIMPSQSDSE